MISKAMIKSNDKKQLVFSFCVVVKSMLCNAISESKFDNIKIDIS